jgi:hypothetical protein
VRRGGRHACHHYTRYPMAAYVVMRLGSLLPLLSLNLPVDDWEKWKTRSRGERGGVSQPSALLALLDTNVPMYAAGAAHPYRDASQWIMSQIARVIAALPFLASHAGEWRKPSVARPPGSAAASAGSARHHLRGEDRKLERAGARVWRPSRVAQQRRMRRQRGTTQSDLGDAPSGGERLPSPPPASSAHRSYSPTVSVLGAVTPIVMTGPHRHAPEIASRLNRCQNRQ